MLDHQPDKQTRHRPWLAAVLSVFIPGAGQLYNKRFIKGILFVMIAFSFLVAFSDFINYGLWGLRTLGEIPGLDHSIYLLVYGILAVLLLVIGLGFYIFNIIDAKRQGEQLAAGESLPSFKEAIKQAYDRAFPYFLTLPGLLFLVFVVIFPLLFAVLLAFTNYNLYNSPPRHLVEWVGFENFINLASVPVWKNTFIKVFSWTIVWTLTSTTLQIALGMFLALLLNDKRIKFKRVIRTILILPWAVPGFVSILIFAALFNDSFGAINRDIIVPLFGKAIPWLSDPFYTKIALIAIQTWLAYPFIFALFTGVLQSISDEWYEAADIDGGSRWQKFRYITFPHLMYTTAPLLIIQYTTNFNNFNIIYLFNQGGPPIRGQTAGGTDILISWVYKLTFDTHNYNMAAAVSLLIGLFVMLIAFFLFRHTRSFKEGGMM